MIEGEVLEKKIKERFVMSANQKSNFKGATRSIKDYEDKGLWIFTNMHQWIRPGRDDVMQKKNYWAYNGACDCKWICDQQKYFKTHISSNHLSPNVLNETNGTQMMERQAEQTLRLLPGEKDNKYPSFKYLIC